MKALLLLFFMLFGFAIQAQSLDKLLSAPSRSAQGAVSSSVIGGVDSADDELRNRISNTQQVLSNNAQSAREFDAGKSCKTDCYRVVSTSSNSIRVMCTVGSRAGQEGTVFKFKDESSYQVSGGGRFKTLDAASRFVCGQ
jgi:hypothetical protein